MTTEPVLPTPRVEAEIDNFFYGAGSTSSLIALARELERELRAAREDADERYRLIKPLLEECRQILVHNRVSGMWQPTADAMVKKLDAAICDISRFPLARRVGK